MSDEQTNAPEDQSQRWLKYGSNTVLVSIVVVLLAVAVVFLAQRKDKRYDTTAAALYTLKPQTLKVIGDNDQPITITSFYSKAKRTDATYGTATAAADADASAALDRQADVVADLLAEYASRGKNITVETIDPKLQPSKADALIEQVTDQYGGEVKAYKAFTDSLKQKFADINAPAKAEAAKVVPLRQQLPDTPQMDDTARMLLYVGRIPTLLDRAQKAYERLLGQKPPDYKAVTSSVTTAADNLSGDLSSILEQFKAIKEAPATGPSALPQPLRDYAASATPTYEKIKAQLDALSKEAKGLGELKLDTIREALHQDNAILVRGKSDWKVIRYDQVWKNDNRDVRAAAAGRGASTIHPRFAGEQMVTTAILALQHPTKQKVCFVRAGGQPLASVGGLFSSVGDRLRDYNFDVSDKDVTGQSQMQSMQMQQPPPPEPTDAEIDDALWVVLPIEQQQQRNPMMGGPTPPGQIADKVAAHVKSGHHIGPDGKRADGGSVFVFAIGGSGGPGGGGGDPLTAALDPFGVKVRPEVTAVHALVKTADAADTGDEINRVLKLPQVFALTDWGHSPMTDTLAGLPGVLLNTVPVEANPNPASGGATATLLVPVPGAPDYPPCWGETDPQSLSQEGTGPTFDAAKDVPAPIMAAAACERPGGARAVVFGSAASFQGSDVDDPRRTIVDYPDNELYARGVVAPRFPGSAEFFMNATFWLTHQEPMIAISPAAMTVARIGPMSRAGAGFWHYGFLLVGLPGLVLAAGAAAYLSRRD